MNRKLDETGVLLLTDGQERTTAATMRRLMDAERLGIMKRGELVQAAIRRDDWCLWSLGLPAATDRSFSGCSSLPPDPHGFRPRSPSAESAFFDDSLHPESLLLVDQRGDMRCCVRVWVDVAIPVLVHDAIGHEVRVLRFDERHQR
jgi:hypothetical protein